MPPAATSSRHRARRRLIFVGMVVLLGGVTTLVLAWLPAFVLLPYGFISHNNDWNDGDNAVHGRSCLCRRSSLLLSDWVQLLFQPPGVTVRTQHPNFELPEWTALPEAGSKVSRVDTGATGWPFRALASEAWYFDDRARGTRREELRHNLELPARGSGRVFLPLRPIWPGLFANAAVYAVGWSVLLLAPIAVRRGLRRRANRCTACGYDRGATASSSLCPECGHPP
jgi:hypothetical protein